jgi:hypothetical protein
MMLSQQQEEMLDRKQSGLKLNDLPRQEEELKDKEAKQIKGSSGTGRG